MHCPLKGFRSFRPRTLNCAGSARKVAVALDGSPAAVAALQWSLRDLVEPTHDTQISPKMAMLSVFIVNMNGT